MDDSMNGGREESILDIMADVLMNERLDELLKNDEGYIKAQDGIDEASAQYDSLNLPHEDRRAADSLISACNAYGAYYAAMAYKQGMKDCAALLREIGVV